MLPTSVTYRLALLVLAPVQHSPVDLSGVPLGQEGRLALGVQKLEDLLKHKTLNLFQIFFLKYIFRFLKHF